MNFVFPRDRVVSSTTGHCIRFQKNVPQFTPSELYKEAMALGGVPESELDPDPPKPVGEIVEPTAPDVREKELFAAFETMVKRNKRGDFTAGGAPHAKALAKLLGWMIDAKERDIKWVEFQTKGKAE